tara:strand:- start:32 stop:265 length:234 start_codon:yes stop_codon:yes gene_type:complete
MIGQGLEQLVKMVNQISANMHGATDQQAADKVATHLQKFWARAMKEQIIAYADDGGEDLTPISRKAVERLREVRAAG